MKRSDGIVTECYALYILQLQKHLDQCGKSLPVTFATSVASLYQGYYKANVLQLFLKPGSSAKYIQTGIEGRKSPNNSYVRAYLIQKRVFSKETIEILDEG